VDKDFKFYRNSYLWDDCGNRVHSTGILKCLEIAETLETVIIDVLNCCKWIRILNFIEIVISGMIAAIAPVVTDILNCLGIADTTETVVIDVLQCWMRRRILNYTNYIEKVLSGMITATESIVQAF
jgi:hypothetical protein